MNGKYFVLAFIVVISCLRSTGHAMPACYIFFSSLSVDVTLHPRPYTPRIPPPPLVQPNLKIVFFLWSNLQTNIPQPPPPPSGMILPRVDIHHTATCFVVIVGSFIHPFDVIHCPLCSTAGRSIDPLWLLVVTLCGLTPFLEQAHALASTI